MAAGTQFLTSSINLSIAGDTAGAAAQEARGRALERAAGELGNRTYAVLGGAGFEGFSTSLFGANNLTVANVLEGAFDASISSGINSAVNGTSFREGLSSGLIRSVVSLGLADAQNEIGSVFAGGANGGEGSIGHILLHGIAGCAAAEASGANCSAGAAGGIAQAVYSAALDGNGFALNNFHRADFIT